MTDDEIVAFAQFLIDRLYGHPIAKGLIRNCLQDYLREKERGGEYKEAEDGHGPH